MIAGFLGILVLPIANVSGSVPLTVAVHVVSVLVIAAFWIRRAGSVTKWMDTRFTATYFVSPCFMVVAGLAFAGAGIFIACFVQPSAGAQAMKIEEIRYFGALFVLLGTGLTVFAGADLGRR